MNRSRFGGRKAASMPEAAKIIRKARINILITFFKVSIEVENAGSKRATVKKNYESADLTGRDMDYPRFEKERPSPERGRE
jgi:hypothetical protein